MEFGTTLDTEAYIRHLRAMDGIENVAGCIWRRRLTKQANFDEGRTITKDEAEASVLLLLANPERGKWWSPEILAVALKYNVVLNDKVAADTIRDDGDIVDLVNCVLHAMVINGRVVRRRTMFRLAVKDEEILGDIRHLLS